MLSSVACHQHLACVGAPEFQHYFSPSPQSCNKYVLCVNGESHIDECSEGFHFDVGQQGCANPQFVDCTQCGPYGFVKLPHAEDCAQYHECTFGQRKLRTCPAGLLFDRMVGACNTDFMVTTCPGMDFPGEDDGVPPLEPPGDWNHPTGPEGPGGPGGPMPSCTTGQVHHAHSSECSKYFLCIHGNLWEHTCPSALHWNERAMACDLPDHAGCSNSPGSINPGEPGVPGQPHPDFPDWSNWRPGSRPGNHVHVNQKPDVKKGTEPIRRLIRVAYSPNDNIEVFNNLNVSI